LRFPGEKTVVKIITFGILLLSVVSVIADSLTITWEPNTEPDLAGYFVYYGTKDRPFGNRIDVGRQTQYFIQNLKPGETYYISVTAVDTAHNESVFIEQIAVKIKYTLIPVAEAGPDRKMLCAGSSVPIGGNPTGSGGHGGPYSFSWAPVTGLDNPTAANPNATPQTTTTYTVTVTEIATGFSAQDSVIVNVPATGWAVAHIVDADDVVAGLNQSTAPRNNRGLALSPDERFLYLGYILNKYLVRKIDLSVADPADNHNAVVAQLILPSGSQPARDIATDDRGRVYLALGDKIEIYNADLQVPPLHTISGFTACEGVAVRREKGKLAVYATDRLDKTLERFVLIEATPVGGAGEAITSSRQGGLDGDGEVPIAGAGSPAGLDIGKYGSIWIADAGKGKVYRVNAAGKTADSTVVERAMDVAIDTTRGEVFVSQYTRRTIKVLNINNGKIKRTLAPPAAGLKVSLDGEARFGALCGIDVASCPQALLSPRVYVANEKGRSILTSGDSPFSNVGDNQEVKAADTDPVLVVAGNAVAKESEVSESEVEESEAAKSEAVTNYELAQNYPNPFNPSTKISFALPEAAEVSLKIYDITGQLVQTLVDGVVEAGRHQVVWDGTNQHGALVASGVYFYQLQAGEFKQVRRMSLVR
jgi:hypothetical protein